MTLLLKRIAKFIIVVYVFVFAFQWWSPFPRELLNEHPTIYQVPDSGVHFFADVTYRNEKDERVTDQEIWHQIFSLIDNAEHVILLDMFLFNDFQGKTPETLRSLTLDLTKALHAKKAAGEHVAVAFVTDPINTVYGGVRSPYLDLLSSSGVLIINTDLAELPDSNLIWSSFWRPFISIWGNSAEGGFAPHPFQYHGDSVPVRSWFALFNMKANHRKLIVLDQPITKRGGIKAQKMVTLVTSANPHDGSSAHGNVAIQVDDQIWQSVIGSEREISSLSGTDLPSFNIGTIDDETGTVQVSFLTEESIRRKAIELFSRSGRGDQIDLATFYLSDRSVIKSMIDAGNRGAIIRVILDPNNNAFGFTKNGIPNRPVAKELLSPTSKGISIRWCDTHGEQCHAKLLMGRSASSSFMMLGSANFTRRNIGGFNLEADILAEDSDPFTAWKDAKTYFDRMWNNTGGTHTVPYEVYKDDSIWKSPLYRMMERTGLSSF